MEINVTYDSSVSDAPAGFINAVNYVVQAFETAYQTPVSVNIDVGWGEVAGNAIAPNALGENITAESPSFTYTQVATALAKDGASINPNAPDPTDGGQFVMTTAEEKALGFMSGNAINIDGYLGFSSGVNYTTDPNNRAIPGQYDLIGIAEHELSEVLGRGLLAGTNGQFSPFDLFHYSAQGTLDLTGRGGYFSLDGGNSVVNTFNPTLGGDIGDWAGATVDSFNEAVFPGEQLPLSPGDVEAMDVLGWNQPALDSQQMVFLNPNQVFFDGSVGNDWIIGASSGSSVIWGGGGDTISGGAADVTIGGAQQDTIFGGTGTEFIDGSQGNQAIIGGTAGNETIWGGVGDTINGGGAATEAIGGTHGDTITGGTGAEFIDGSQGNQVITGGNGGNETVWGGAGDTINGGGDATETIGGGQYDTITGGTGTERVDGWLGHQLIIGGSAGDEMLIGAHTDTVDGGSGGNEFIDGTAGGQQITGGSGGNETIWGGAGDTIGGGGNANETIGGVAWDTITGGSGTEFIDGSEGHQSITAGSGNDTIWGGTSDTITGASGQAIIGLGSGPEFIGANFVGGGMDTVAGFNLAGGDRVILSSDSSIPSVLATAASGNGGTTITFGNGSTLTLAGITHIDSSFFS
jgi:Ca2+-binding RTX toxin-like protein